MANKYYVYRNLNDPTDVVVLDGEQVTLGIYELVAGPMAREAAEKKAAELKKGKAAE